MLNTEELKRDIKEAFKAEQTEEEDYEASLERIAEKIAQAVIKQIKQIKITNTQGLALQSGGTVSGVFNYTIS